MCNLILGQQEFWALGDARGSISPWVIPQGPHEQRSCSRGSSCGSCSSLGTWFEGQRGNRRHRNENKHPGDAAKQPGLQGWEKGKGDWRGQGKAANSVVPPCRAAAHPKNNSPVPKSGRRKRQALPKATLMLSRKSPIFILLELEPSPSSGKQPGEFLSASVDPELSGKKTH